jgi:A/G-specific adenine glycosylase
MSRSPLVAPLLDWFDEQARDLPWRQPGTSAWSVLVSEVMLQQTPVARVLPVYTSWLEHWPTPADLAAAPAGDAVRRWGKLGYPGRALRLHVCARVVAERHGGLVPDDLDALLALPGVGEYTARAILAFAYQRRAPVVDTNVRRVLARALAGQQLAGSPSTRRDLALMQSLLPTEAAVAARFCAATMELGALLCTSRTPACDGCPIAAQCAWRRAGYPAHSGPRPRHQSFAGTDRQIRGRLLDVLRGSDRPVSAARLDTCWPDADQRARALGSLIADGLIEPLPDGTFALPQ